MNSLEAYAMLDASLNNPGLVAQVVPPPHTMKIEQHIIDLITEGYIGVLVSCETGSANKVQEALNSAGAEEIKQ